jgi:hypothetical protein
MRSWKYRTTPDSALGIEIVSTASQAVLNSTMYAPSSFGPKIMMRCWVAPLRNRTPSIWKPAQNGGHEVLVHPFELLGRICAARIVGLRGVAPKLWIFQRCWRVAHVIVPWPGKDGRKSKIAQAGYSQNDTIQPILDGEATLLWTGFAF